MVTHAVVGAGGGHSARGGPPLRPVADTLNAATMLGQSKTAHQAEIDAAAELIDFWRFNVAICAHIYEEQPISSAGVWNRLDYRPLEGFVFAVTPFNFTSIARQPANPPALMGNTVVWKPASTAMYAAHFIMAILRAAGLPDGVINLVYGSGGDGRRDGARASRSRGRAFHRLDGGLPADVADDRREYRRYRNYPRIVGETGGKNFIVAHPSADVAALVDGDRPRRLRVPGAEVLGGLARLRAGSLWPALRDQFVARSRRLRWATSTRISQLHGRGD